MPVVVFDLSTVLFRRDGDWAEAVAATGELLARVLPDPAWRDCDTVFALCEEAIAEGVVTRGGEACLVGFYNPVTGEATARTGKRTLIWKAGRRPPPEGVCWRVSEDGSLSVGKKTLRPHTPTLRDVMRAVARHQLTPS